MKIIKNFFVVIFTIFFMTNIFAKQNKLPILYSTPNHYKQETGKIIQGYNEAPMLNKLVKSNKLPPVKDRLPLEPAVIQPVESIGKYGGYLKGPATNPNNRGWDILEMRLQKLLTFGTDYRTPIPNIAKSFNLSNDMKTLTIELREGMKWSDGHPFTVDDFEFFYKHIILNKEIYPKTPKWFKSVKFKRLNKYKFQWLFNDPNPSFVIRIASEREEGGVRPKHYLTKFHKEFNPDVSKLAKELKYENWVQMFKAKHEPYTRTPFAASDQDPFQPTIETYVYVKTDSYGNKLYERNPYYFKVDTAGNQLPYTDGMRRILVENLEVQDLKGIAGDYTHYGWGGLQNYTTYKENEEKGGYTTRLLTYLRGNELTLSFNVLHPDPVKQKVFSNLKFRQAMSLSINREEINNLIYFGKATPRQASPAPNDSYYQDWMGNYYAEFDPVKANKLLDSIGLDKRDSDGFRLGPDGKLFTINMEQGVPEPAWQKTCELVAKYWNDAGIKTNLKMIQVNLFRQKRSSGKLDVPGWGYDVGEVNFYSGGTWRVLPPYGNGANGWERWIDTNGGEGIEPPNYVKNQVKLYNEWSMMKPDNPKYPEYARKIFETQIKNLYAIGTVGLPPQPLLLDKRLRNAPTEGEYWSWTFRQWVQFLPEQFWLE